MKTTATFLGGSIYENSKPPETVLKVESGYGKRKKKVRAKVNVELDEERLLEDFQMIRKIFETQLHVETKGFHLATLTATKKEVQTQLKKFFADYDEEAECFLVYYGGHSTVDGEWALVDDILNHKEFLKIWENSPPASDGKLLILINDSCYADAFSSKMEKYVNNRSVNLVIQSSSLAKQVTYDDLEGERPSSMLMKKILFDAQYRKIHQEDIDHISQYLWGMPEQTPTYFFKIDDTERFPIQEYDHTSVSGEMVAVIGQFRFTKVVKLWEFEYSEERDEEEIGEEKKLLGAKLVSKQKGDPVYKDKVEIFSYCHDGGGFVRKPLPANENP